MSDNHFHSGKDYAGRPEGVLLQGFHWRSHEHSWYRIIKELSPVIREGGFEAVWFPPPAVSADPHGYLPTEWYNADSRYGSREELIDAIRSLHPAEAIADIVVNHRCGLHDWADFHNPDFAPEGTTDPSDIAEANRKAVVSEDEWKKNGGRPAGQADSGEQFDGGRDLDHHNPHVQTAVVGWLRWLKEEIGFAGWRWDYARGFDPAFVGQYNEATGPSVSIGEYTGSEPREIADWIEGTGRGGKNGRSSAFDFSTRGFLKRAVEEKNFALLKTVDGKPAGLIGLLPGLAVTFLDSHDTEPANHDDPFPTEHVLMGYAYLMTHPGRPCVFWPHYFDWEEPVRQTIGRLIEIRKRMGIGAASAVNILAGAEDLYAAVIDEATAVKIGPGAWNPPEEGWEAALDGPDFAIWTRPRPGSQAGKGGRL